MSELLEVDNAVVGVDLIDLIQRSITVADGSSLARAFKRAGWRVIGVEERG